MGITVGRNPQPSSTSRATAAETQIRSVGPTTARSWQATSSGVVKVSRWWIVRTHPPDAMAAFALMQSWACTTSYDARSDENARPSTSIERNIRAPTDSSSPRSAKGTARTVTESATGRKNVVSPPRPSVQTSTSTPSVARASASAKVCTTPPRGRVE